MLLLSGPAEAVVISISGLDGATIRQDTTKSFTVNVTLESFDRYVPIVSMSLNISDSNGSVKNWTFNPITGDIISPAGDTNVTINVIHAPSSTEYGVGYGYGYGYGSDTGYGAGDFGYGYGYGYNQGAGGANVTFTYNVTLDVRYLDVGSYVAQVHVNTGKTVKPRFSSSTATFTVTPVTTDLTPYINTTTGNFNQTVNITSPQENIIITIPNGTNATYPNGTTLGFIMVNSTTSLPTAANLALSSDDRVISEIVDLGPEGARFDPPIQIRFNYTEPLPSGVSEDDLKVKFYNSTTGSWETLPTYEHNKNANYIIANVSHFTTYTVIGTVSAAPSVPSLGGGGGASGVASGEPFNNIAKRETRDQFLYAGREVVYRFTTPELSVYEIAVTATKNTGLISAQVELLKNTSRLVDNPPDGIVYKNINIWLGTSGFATPKNIKDAAVRFKVEKSWLSDNKLVKEDVSLVKWQSDKWVKLPTAVLKEDDDYVYYEAHTTSFSPFAIVAKSTAPEAVAPGVPVTPPTVIPTEAPGVPEKTAVPTPTKKGIPGFELVFAGVALLAVYLLYRKR
jgi:PGF-pre-PGF domain-containing protein